MMRVSEHSLLSLCPRGAAGPASQKAGTVSRSLGVPRSRKGQGRASTRSWGEWPVEAEDRGFGGSSCLGQAGRTPACEVGPG